MGLILLSVLAILTSCHENEGLSRKEQCLRTPCTDSLCLIWDDQLERCGTPAALSNEKQRISPDKEQKSLSGDTLRYRLEKRKLERVLDSLRNSKDSVLSAKKYYDNQMEKELNKIKSIQDSIDILNLKNGKELTAIQWFEYKKILLETRVENLDSIEQKKIKAFKSLGW